MKILEAFISKHEDVKYLCSFPEFPYFLQRVCMAFKIKKFLKKLAFWLYFILSSTLEYASRLIELTKDPKLCNIFSISFIYSFLRRNVDF